MWLKNDNIAAKIKGCNYVFFDFDGTLSNTIDTICVSLDAVLHKFGMSDEEIGDTKRLAGPPFPDAFEIFLGVSHEDALKLLEMYRAEFASHGSAAYKPYDGIFEVLGDLKDNGKTLALTTSREAKMARKMSQDNGLFDYLDYIVGNDDSSPISKVEAVLNSIKITGADTDDAVMIGDRLYDIEGGRANNILTVGCAYGAGTIDELKEAGASAVVDSVNELHKLLV